MKLRPTQVLIFGNPKAGTPLMQVAQSVGIDLSLNALAWEDEVGKTRPALSWPTSDRRLWAINTSKRTFTPASCCGSLDPGQPPGAFAGRAAIWREEEAVLAASRVRL